VATPEAKVINSVCKNKDMASLLSLQVDDLFVGYADVWQTLKTYYSKHRKVPDLSVLQERHDDLEAVEVNGETSHYVDELRSEFINNRMETIMERAGEFLKTEAPTLVLSRMQQELARLNKYTAGVRDFNLTDVNRLTEHFEERRQRSEEMQGVPGITTGIKFIDQAYSTGMGQGHLVVSIGWPGKGKTWLASYIAMNAFFKGYKPMIFSLEMTSESMAERIVTMMGDGLFSNAALTRGDINMDDFSTFSKKKLLDRQDFILVERDGIADVTPNMIGGKIEQYKPDFVVLDYAQLFSDNRHTEGMTPRMMNFSREVKGLATANRIPILLITAATAEENSDLNDPPTLHKVAWSKSIEYDADHAFAVQYNEESGLFEVVCRKNRWGPYYAGFLNWDIDKGIIREQFDF